VTNSLNHFFDPRGIAIIGASHDPRKLGYIILDNLIRGGFAGALYPVNLAAEPLLGLPAYPTVAKIRGVVDLAIIVVPATAVADAIDDCAKAHVSSAVIITAGFRERGAEGAASERDVMERARRGNVRIIGPNSVGLINTATNLNATFAAAQPRRYPVALMSQSGAVATAILDWARTTGVGFSKFVSLGNTADINEVEVLEYLGGDSETRTVIVYLESLSDGRAFLDVARMVTRSKPVIAMKVGRSAAGARAAASHTGAMASSDAIVDSAFRQVGVARAYSMEELFDLTLAFSYISPPFGPRTAVITNAGGPGVMAVDAIERSGIELASLSPTTRAALVQVLPTAASVGNPVDVLGDARSTRYAHALEMIHRDEGVDAVIALLTPQAMTDAEQTARAIAHVAHAGTKPVIASFMGGDAVAAGRALLDEARVPVFAYPERAVRAMAALWAYRCYLNGLEP
jgi:acetyltransferase